MLGSLAVLVLAATGIAAADQSFKELGPLKSFLIPNGNTRAASSGPASGQLACGSVSVAFRSSSAMAIYRSDDS